MGKTKEKTRSWFVKRWYPKKLIHFEVWKNKFNIREPNKKNKSKNRLFSVVRHYPLLNSLDSIFRKNSYLVNIDQKIKDIFILKSMESFSNALKLSTFWVEPNTCFGKKSWLIQISFQSLLTKLRHKSWHVDFFYWHCT